MFPTHRALRAIQGCSTQVSHPKFSRGARIRAFQSEKHRLNATSRKFWVAHLSGAPLYYICGSVQLCLVNQPKESVVMSFKTFALTIFRALRARFFKLKYLFLNQIYHETHDLARRRRFFCYFMYLTQISLHFCIAFQIFVCEIQENFP